MSGHTGKQFEIQEFRDYPGGPVVAYALRDSSGRLFCKVSEAEDARLIAAAPDLLAACEAALESHGLDVASMVNAKERAIVEQLRAAIVKATGGEL